MEYRFSNTDDLLNFLNDNLLSTVEAAEVLDVSQNRLGQFVKSGKLIAVKKQPNFFLKSMVLEKKEELESPRKKI